MTEPVADVVKKTDLMMEMEACVPTLLAQAAGGDFQGSLDELLGHEKKCRMVRTPFSLLKKSPLSFTRLHTLIM